MPKTSPSPDPIRRGEPARQRVMRAALKVLTDEGMAGFSIEAVAREAGASKATIYRRWPSPPALLVDAMEVATQPFRVPDTGSLRSDLIDLGSKLEGLLRDQESSRLIAAFIDAAERDTQLRDLLVRLGERRREVLRKVLVAARDRGEVPRTRDLELLVDLLAAPAFYRRFIGHISVPRGYTAAVVDLVMAAAVGPPPIREESPSRTRRRIAPLTRGSIPTA